MQPSTILKLIMFFVNTFIHVWLFHQSTDLVCAQVKYLDPKLKTKETITPILITY